MQNHSELDKKIDELFNTAWGAAIDYSNSPDFEPRSEEIYLRAKSGWQQSFREDLATLIADAQADAVKKYIEPHIAYCEQQNGLPHCKNYGLARYATGEGK